MEHNTSLRRYANETLRMLDAHDPSDPLYVYLAWNNVHDPNEAPQHYIDMHSGIKDENRRNLAAMMSALDDSLTAVVDKLKAKGELIAKGGDGGERE